MKNYFIEGVKEVPKGYEEQYLYHLYYAYVKQLSNGTCYVDGE